MSRKRSSNNCRRVISKRRMGSSKMDSLGFIDCPTGGAVAMKRKNGNRLHVFNSIGFTATDTKGKCFDVDGLSFDQEKGWFDANVVIPKYYGKKVYEACLEYAVDIAIRDNLYLGLAFLGKERPAKAALVISHNEVAMRLESRSFAVTHR